MSYPSRTTRERKTPESNKSVDDSLFKPLRAVMSEIPTRNYRHAQDLHAIDRRQPSLLPGVGHDYEWHLHETLLGEVYRRRGGSVSFIPQVPLAAPWPPGDQACQTPR